MLKLMAESWRVTDVGVVSHNICEMLLKYLCFASNLVVQGLTRGPNLYRKHM